MILADLLRKPLITADEESTEPERSREDIHSLEQDIYMFRMRMLHFINGLHEYIMTTVNQVGQ